MAAGRDLSVICAFNASRGGSEALLSLLSGSAVSLSFDVSLSFNGVPSTAADGGTLAPTAVFGGGVSDVLSLSGRCAVCAALDPGGSETAGGGTRRAILGGGALSAR